MAASKENTREDLKEINNHLLDNVKLKNILEYDKLIQHLFENTFYNFGSDNEENANGINMDLKDKTEGGILYHFVKNLKMIKAYSAITNSLPCIITGSVVEGASLARLHHQNLADDAFEIEADIMYVVGSIKDEFKDQIIEPLLNNPGFLWLKYTPDILHFTDIPKQVFQDKYCEFKQMSEEVKYINGQKLKVILKDLQPSNKSYQRIFFQPFPSEINIKQNMNGPSAEIVLTTRFLHGKDDTKMFVLLLEKILERLKESFQFYVDALEWFCVVEKSANPCIDALFKWIKENEKYVNEVSEDLDDMAFQIFQCVLVYKERSLKFKRTYHNLIQFLSYLNYVMLDQPSYSFDSLKHELNCSNLWKILNGDHSKYQPFDNVTPGNIYEKLEKIQKYHLNLNFYHSLKEETYVALMDNYHLLHGLITSKIDQVKNNVFQMNPEDISNNHIVSFDNVFCFHCYFWPKAANEWCTRKRLWPNTTTISKIKDAGCHIVSKSNPDSNEELDWRWSFSSAEIKIAKERSPAQRYCYFIFKTLFYKYLKFQVKDKSLPSYIAKTCMFYVSELHEEDWWSGALNDMSTVAVYVLELFQYLECELQKGFLAHYFINEINLLEGFSKQHIEKAIDVTKNIINDPKQYLRFSSSVLQKINSINKEIQTHAVDLEGVTKKVNDAYSNTLEHTKITNNIKLHEELTYTKALNCRAFFLIECSQIQLRKYEFIKTLEMFSRLEILSRTKSGKHIAKHQKLVTDLEIQFTNTYHNTKLGLKRMANLLKLHCKRCDICFKEITCQALRYCCIEGCDYDECEACYTKEKREGNVNETVTKKGVEDNESDIGMKGTEENHAHAHPLIETHECSNYCFMFTEGYFKEEQVMKTYQFYMKQYSSFTKPILDLSNRIGHNDRTRCERLEDPGEITKVLMEETFKERDAHKRVKDDEDEKLERAKTEASVEIKEKIMKTEDEDGIINQMRDETEKKTDVKDTSTHKADDVEAVKESNNLQEKNDTASKSINNNSVFNHLQSIKTFFRKTFSAVKKTVVRKEVEVERINTVATGDEDNTTNAKEDFIKSVKDVITEMMVLMIDMTFEGNNIFNDGEKAVNDGDKVINNEEVAVNNGYRNINGGGKATNNAEEAINNGYKVSNDGDEATNNVDKISLLKDDGQFLRECKDIETDVSGINRLKFMEEYLFQT